MGQGSRQALDRRSTWDWKKSEKLNNEREGIEGPEGGFTGDNWWGESRRAKIDLPYVHMTAYNCI